MEIIENLELRPEPASHAEQALVFGQLRTVDPMITSLTRASEMASEINAFWRAQGRLARARPTEVVDEHGKVISYGIDSNVRADWKPTQNVIPQPARHRADKASAKHLADLKAAHNPAPARPA